MADIPVDASVIEGRCVICGDRCEVPATAGDATGAPIPAGAVPDDAILVRMCDDCRARFDAWRAAELARAELPN